MLPSIFGVLGGSCSLVYADPARRTGLTVSARVTLDSVLVTTVALGGHPTIPGVYVGGFVPAEVGSYVVTYVVEGVDEDLQPLHIFESASSLHPTRIAVVDRDTENPMPEVVVVVTSSDGIGRELVVYDYTDDSGEVAFKLPDGRYLVTLVKPPLTFSTNNYELEVDESQDEFVCRFEAYGIEVPDTSYVPPMDVVTMTVRLVDLSGDPVPYRDVVVTGVAPVSFEGNRFLATEGRRVKRTSPTGVCSFTLVPGMSVEVAVSNTSVIRRFVVPDEDFDFARYLGNNDFFSVQNVEYPEAERTS